MTTAVQRRRGTNTEHATFTGLDGEITVNTTTYTLHVHDGATVGGVALAKADGSNLVTSSIDINGGTIDGTVIGGSSAAAGSFTTISASGEIAANGGIALGDNDKATFGASDDLQIYHDGSHSYIDEVGTGSLYVRANDFRLANDDGSQNHITAANNGAVSLRYSGSPKLATTATGIDVTGTVTADGLTVDGAVNIQNGSVGTDVAVAIGSSGTPNKQLFYAGGDVAFTEDTGTTAKFFWDASAESLGIGTTSPAYKIDSNGSVRAYSSTFGDSDVIAETTAATGTGYSRFILKTTDREWRVINDASTSGSPLLIYDATAATERMRIDSSGNVGINTTPKAWTAFNPVLQIKNASTGGGGALAGTSADNFRMFANTYYDGAYKRLATGFATQYGQESGAHVWSYAASGAADSTFTWSEAARIDSSGNLLVGTTTPSPGNGNTTVGISAKNDGRLFVSGASYSGFNRTATDGDIVLFRKDGTTVGSIGVAASDNLYIGGSATDHTGLVFPDNAILPAKELAATDNFVDLGTSSRRFKDLYLSGGVTTNTTTGLSITANATNRGILNLSTSQSYQLLGGAYYGYTGYKTGGYHRWFGSDGAEDMRIDSSGNLLVGTTTASIAATNNTGAVIVANGASQFSRDGGHVLDINRVQDGEIVRFRSAGNAEGSISISGSTTFYNITSDERLKENIVDTTHTVDINDIKVRQYDWKSNGEHQRYGFIAQELEAVYPEAVFSPEDPEEMKAVDYSKLVPLLVKEIQDLKAEVAALKGA